MATTLFDRLRAEMDQISSAYDRDFAGQARSTRDIGAIDELIRRTTEVLRRIDEIPSAAQGPQLTELRGSVQGSLETYENEKKQILLAKEQGPEFREFGRYASLANFTFAKYGRHFAGHNRLTRDTGLLAEMREDLKQLKKRMQAVLSKKKNANFERDAQIVEQNIALYEKELGEIQKAQEALAAADRAGLMAELANAQFALYRVHFAGKSRLTRRPQLLQRMVDNLKRVKKTMDALIAANEGGEHTDKNVEIVTQNLNLYETELAEVRKARQGTKMPDLMGSLGGAANELFEAYRSNFAGKNRNEVDRQLLSDLCDQLHEILRQMTDLSRAEEVDSNERNIDIVMDQLAMFEQEWEAVTNAQRPAQAAEATGTA